MQMHAKVDVVYNSRTCLSFYPSFVTKSRLNESHQNMQTCRVNAWIWMNETQLCHLQQICVSCLGLFYVSKWNSSPSSCQWRDFNAFKGKNLGRLWLTYTELQGDFYMLQLSGSNPYSGVELQPWTFQWDLTLHLLIWTVSHINRSLHHWTHDWWLRNDTHTSSL